MKLELLDVYNIRARLSASIILLAPVAITIFLCFGEIATFATSSIILVVLLAFTNYIPILQRQICANRPPFTNYVSQFLRANDSTIDSVSKQRYYRILSQADPSFSPFEHPDDSDTFLSCCDSAAKYLRAQTRGNLLVQEENINYGFCRNLWANKAMGIILCIVSGLIAVGYSWLKYKAFAEIPLQYYFAVAADLTLLLFWIFGISRKIVDSTAISYAKTLIASIDTLNKS